MSELYYIYLCLDVGIGTLHLGPGDGNHGRSGLGPRDHHAQLILALKRTNVNKSEAIKRKGKREPDNDSLIYEGNNNGKTRCLRNYEKYL